MRIIARFFIVFLLLPFNMAAADANELTPNAELTPDQVVVIVIDALKNNNPANNDDGIATVFEFASPGNKSVTGPIDRFTNMIKGGFADMLNHFDSSFGEMEITNNKALQAVWLTSRNGVETGYVFQLGKQSGGEFDGMWMTESVWPISEKNPRGKSI